MAHGECKAHPPATLNRQGGWGRALNGGDGGDQPARGANVTLMDDTLTETISNLITPSDTPYRTPHQTD